VCKGRQGVGTKDGSQPVGVQRSDRYFFESDSEILFDQLGQPIAYAPTSD